MVSVSAGEKLSDALALTAVEVHIRLLVIWQAVTDSHMLARTHTQRYMNAWE